MAEKRLATQLALDFRITLHNKHLHESETVFSKALMLKLLPVRRYTKFYCSASSNSCATEQFLLVLFGQALLV